MGINKIILDGTEYPIDTAPIATVETAGKVKPDGSTITIESDGTITAVNSSTQEQSDWEQTDNTQVDYIKNKPDIAEMSIDNDTLIVNDGTSVSTSSNTINYSLIEQDTGVKWIDNKPIYQITVTDISMTSAGASEVASIPTMDTLISIEGTFTWSNGSIFTMNYKYSTTDSASFYVDTSKTVWCQNDSSSRTGTVIATIRYTKTTD